jgi:hypothetical protein
VATESEGMEEGCSADVLGVVESAVPALGVVVSGCPCVCSVACSDCPFGWAAFVAAALASAAASVDAF